MLKGTHAEIRAYMRKYIKARYRKVMDEIITFLGGKCVRCGSTVNLQTDHINRETKLFNISTGIQNYSKEKLWEEVKKCQLLCKKCHREKGIENGDVHEMKHGGVRMVKEKCKCELCQIKRDAINARRREIRKFGKSVREVEGGGLENR